MMSELFPLIEVSGAPYELGFQHGRLAQAQVQYTLERYKELFFDYSGLAWADATRLAQRYIAPIERYDAGLLAEMRGVADGAGVPFEDILALNARSELALSVNLPSDGCTALAVCPERTADGHALLGQNWDWKPTQRPGCIVLKITRTDRPSILMVTEAGIIGKIGLNDRGLGVCLNAMGTDRKPEGLPLHIALRGILDSPTLSDAVDAAGRAELGCAANFLCGHADGEAISIESVGEDYDVLYPEDGILAHTNHITSPRLAGYHDTFKRRMPDTFVRRGRITKLARRQSPITVEDFKLWFSDHVEYPDSICRHADPHDPEGLRMGTVFSIVMDLTENLFWMAPGEPCQTDYRLYRL